MNKLVNNPGDISKENRKILLYNFITLPKINQIKIDRVIKNVWNTFNKMWTIEKVSAYGLKKFTNH